MPVARFQLPDGRVARFEVPEGTTPEQAQSMIQAQLPSLTQPQQPELPESLRPSVAQVAPNEVPGARKELSTGQKIYQAVRPYAAPLVEAGGAIGGGLLGATAGTFGAGPVGTAAAGVAGAGLGYGIAKEAIEAADVAVGMKAPRQGAAQIAEPVRNILEGATFEAGGRVAGPLIAKGVSALADLRNIPKNKAAEIARNALGPDLPEVLNALKASQGQGVSAAQATAGINSPTWQALLDRVSKRDPRFLAALEKSQGEVSLNALTKLAGGSTAAEARGTTEIAKKNLNTITTPMREAALGRANIGKYVADEAALREANDLAVMTGSGGQIDPARFAAQATGAEKALRSVGIKPLEGNALADKIASIPENPAFAENDLIKGAADRVSSAIRQWTGSNGVIDANALEAIRKNAVEATIAQLRPSLDATAQRNAAAGVMTRIKPLIDTAIEDAGGAGWRDYLAAHTKGMQQLAEKKLTGEALKLWKTNKDEFVRLVTNEAPETVEKFLGKGNYNIASELADNTMSTLKTEAEKVVRDANIKSQVSGGQDALKQLLLENMSKLRVPSYLSAVAATTNKALNILENKIGAKTMAMLTEASKTPEGAAALLETLPATERSRVLGLIADPSKWSSGAKAAVTGSVTTGVNALAPDRYNTNALANQPVRVIELNNMAPDRP